MKQIEHHIGLIGAGNMGEAMAGAMIRAGLVQPGQITISDIRPERLEELNQAYGIGTTDNNGELFAGSDILIVAVKPQQIDALLDQLTAGLDSMESRKLVISIAAGIPLKRFEERLYAGLDEKARKNLPVIRVMPNTPALVLAGMSGMSPNANTTEEDVEAARAIFQAMGKVALFAEKDLDAVTALSGSGPAYVFYLAEAMAAGGVAAGLTPEASAELTLATLEGAVKLMAGSNDTPRILRQKVTSPGGTTEAAVRVLDTGNVQQTVADAIVAAARRAGELSR